MKITKTDLKGIEYRIVEEKSLEWKFTSIDTIDAESGKQTKLHTFIMKNDVWDFEYTDRPYFGALFSEDDSLRFFGFIKEGRCTVGLYLHFESDSGLFVSGVAGEIYDAGVLKLLSAWHDKTEPQEKTDKVLSGWAKEKIQSILALKDRI